MVKISKTKIHLITYGDNHYTLSRERLKMQAEKQVGSPLLHYMVLKTYHTSSPISIKMFLL